MRIREATPEDFGEIARITLDAYRALETWVGDWYATELADVARRAVANTVLVAEGEGGEILGSVTLVMEGGSWFEWRFGEDGDCGFRMLAVDPPAQGKGVGSALVVECLDRARRAGRTRMIIGSTPWMTTAHRIYEGLGFRRRPDIDQQWGDIPGWAFVLDLNEAGP
jgi:GNAT superfamily N-acetyltransferase